MKKEEMIKKVNELKKRAYNKIKEIQIGNEQRLNLCSVGVGEKIFAGSEGMLYEYNSGRLRMIGMTNAFFNSINKTCFNELLIVETPYRKESEGEKISLFAYEDGEEKKVAELDYGNEENPWKVSSGGYNVFRNSEREIVILKDVYAAKLNHPLCGEVYIGDDGRIYNGEHNSFLKQKIGVPLSVSCNTMHSKINSNLETKAINSARKGYDISLMNAAKKLWVDYFRENEGKGE